ncbi:putative leucine-rich repeat-containing protein DDB_G0290503 [Bombus flavifrons]|uniref:putative leucine-rich repeat-containing protein DDB_G0290503 n=1 Tax=Bombus flavifrons TaxID=103934 RepID=UPI0037044681
MQKELSNLEKECLLLREELCSKDHLLQNEQKISNELKIRLKLASETIVRLEEENMHNKIDYSNLSMNYETLLKESDVLTKEALSCQTETAKVKLKITSLENILRNIAKIAKEQQYLLESSKAAIQLNRRLQTFGLCSHAINKRNKANIRELQHKLTALSVNEFNKLSNNSILLHPEMENLCFKLKEMLTNLETKMQDSVPFEEKLDRIFNELSTNLI